MKNFLYLALSLILLSPSVVEATESTQKLSNQQVGILDIDSEENDDELKVHLSNFYGEFPAEYAVYGAKGNLSLFIYTNEIKSKLTNVYVILPQGIKLAGDLDVFQVAVDKMVENSPISGTVTASKLVNTQDGREVYQLEPSEGASVEANPAVRNTLELPIQVTKDHEIKEASINANDLNSIGQNILFVGAGDGTNIKFDQSIAMYKEVNANEVGINSATDEKVRGIVYPGIKRTVTFINLTIFDTYKLVDSYGRSIAEDIVKNGESNTTYSREGLITTAENWGINPSEYDLDTLSIDDDNLSGETTLTGQEVFTNNPNATIEGETHVLTIKKFAEQVTAHYVDENGDILAPEKTYDGHVGDSYETNPATIEGWVLKEAPENAKGEFTENKQDVYYVYLKEEPTESTESETESETESTESETESTESERESNEKKELIVPTTDASNSKDDILLKLNKKNKNMLPQTGEKNVKSISIVGIILLMVVGYYIYRRKQK